MTAITEQEAIRVLRDTLKQIADLSDNEVVFGHAQRCARAAFNATAIIQPAAAPAQAAPADEPRGKDAIPEPVISDGKLWLCALDAQGLVTPIAQPIKLPDHWTDALFNFACFKRAAIATKEGKA